MSLTSFAGTLRLWLRAPYPDRSKIDMRIFLLLLVFMSGNCMGDTDKAWDELVEISYEELRKQQDILETDFDLSKHERWNFYQEAGRIVFSNSGKPTVVAKFQFVGSISTESNTWLWGWANSSIEEDLYEKLHAVYEYGNSRGFNKLIDDKWKAEEVDGWEMAAVANYLIKGKGVYRPPFGKGYTFMVITSIEWISE
ncbi:MAG: DUF6882 domain-containing protein [Candidatus Thiodiazotropha sp.]